MKNKKELKVSAIKNGTVIDHIPARNLFKVIKILNLDKIQNQITFGTNFESGRLGKKAIVKISDKYFEGNEINKIALAAPTAKLNVIKDYQVTEKHDIKVPNMVEGIAKCVNPKCVTNHEDVKTKFTIIDKDNIALKCHYCEKITSQDYLGIE